MRTIRKQITADLLASMMQREIASASDAILKAQSDFAQNPAHALSWSFQVYKDAATLELAQAVLYMLDEGRTKEGIVQWLDSEILRSARCPSYSTSPNSNQIDRERLAAKANLLERVIEFEESIY